MLSQCTLCQSSQQNLEAAGEQKSHPAPGAPGMNVVTHSVGMVNHANTDEPEASERKSCCCLSSAKKPGQKYSTEMLNASLSGMSCDFLCGRVGWLFTGTEESVALKPNSYCSQFQIFPQAIPMWLLLKFFSRSESPHYFPMSRSSAISQFA